MSLTVLRSGLLDTIQDLGRPGYRQFGINPGGAMDRRAVRLANLLVGNPENTSVVELHFPAASFRFGTDAAFAISGGDFGAQLDDQPVETWSSFEAKEGSVLRFTRKRSGNRTYLAVAGGLDVERWLGSSSTNLTAQIGGFAGRRLQAGDVIRARSAGKPHKLRRHISPSVLPLYSRFPTVRVTAGAELGSLSDGLRDSLFKQAFTVSQDADRMGFRLNGVPLNISASEPFVSTPVDFGTIQLLPSGQLVILMADHQTTGGYPRLLHVISSDISLVAQLGPGDKVGFHLVDIAEAERLSIEDELNLNFIRAACTFHRS